MAATLSGETTTVENGKTKTEGCKVTVQFATMYKPVRTIIYQMNEANQVLKQTAYKLSLIHILNITEANLSVLRSGKAKGVRFHTINRICYFLQCDVGDILKFIFILLQISIEF